MYSIYHIVDTETQGQKDKRTKEQKDKIFLKKIFEVFCCILGMCSFLFLHKTKFSFKTHKEEVFTLFINTYSYPILFHRLQSIEATLSNCCSAITCTYVRQRPQMKISLGKPDVTPTPNHFRGPEFFLGMFLCSSQDQGQVKAPDNCRGLRQPCYYSNTTKTRLHFTNIPQPGSFKT